MTDISNLGVLELEELIEAAKKRIVGIQDESALFSTKAFSIRPNPKHPTLLGVYRFYQDAPQKWVWSHSVQNNKKALDEKIQWIKDTEQEWDDYDYYLDIALKAYDSVFTYGAPHEKDIIDENTDWGVNSSTEMYEHILYFCKFNNIKIAPMRKPKGVK